jgi:hypothetical protein
MALAGALIAVPAAHASAQVGVGQTALAGTAALARRGVSALQGLNQNGPGWLYFGVNPADRGLGYNGGYMTLGGFIPYAEDDLGGFWAADLRGHLSEYGGFFSNVGAVRKQFIGGTLLGVGVYWDYDGDQNQYPTGGACGTDAFGQFGHSYNQVGVSGEWLTDYGNLRSNGYIPVGRTANTAGNPGSMFYQNYVMAQYGLDAALGGADLEVGAYVPGLSQWAGMINVGGYALGNTRYDWSSGPLAGQGVVPWFGGVYTRLDMTFLENWDFSIQYNNDSYFDSTGFVRLTYRMGGSRRRNVPDQVEQPMWRNEHIVRAHQTPEVAYNPSTGTPWNVIHVNNAAAASGTGTAEAPFTTIAAANAAAVNPYDIVFVAAGNATYAQSQPFTPLAANQYFIGDGAPYVLPTVCGPINIATGSLRPTISNPTGASVTLDGGLTTANFIVSGSRVGVEANSGLLVGDVATVSNYEINGSGVGTDLQTGIKVVDTSGTVNFSNTLVQNMTDTTFLVDANGKAPIVNFEGSLINDTATNGGVATPIIAINDSLGGGGGEINIATGGTPAGATVANKVSDTGGLGVIVENSAANVKIDNMTLADTAGTAVTVSNSAGSVTIGANGPALITDPANGAILVEGGAPTFLYSGAITNNTGHAVMVDATTGGSVIVTNPTGTSAENGLGLLVQNSAGEVTIEKFTIDSTQQGLLVQNNTFSGSGGEFNNLTIDGATTAGVSLTGNTGPLALETIDITTDGATGFLAVDNEKITMTGNNAVTTTGAAALSVTNSAAINDTTELVFTSLSSTGSKTNGVLLNGVDGSLDVTGAGITVANPTGVGVLMQNTQTGLLVNVPGTVSVTGAPAGGISLVNINQSNSDSILFNAIDVVTTGGTGLIVTNSVAPAFGNGLFQVNGGSITSTAGAAITASNANLLLNLTKVSSTGAASSGLSFINSDNSSSIFPAVTIGTTTVATAATNGIFLQGNLPQAPGGGVFADLGTLSVTGSGQAGIFVQNTNASFTGATISTSGTNGIQLVANNGEETTLLFQNSIINGAGNNGVNIVSNIGGTVNATLLNNGITATGNSIAAVTQDASSTILLNASGNAGAAGGAPTGAILLNNTAAGTLGVVQQASGATTLDQAIANDNNGATVTLQPNAAAISEGVVVPTP